MSVSNYLLGLAERLMRVPAFYGVDGGDIDELSNLTMRDDIMALDLSPRPWRYFWHPESSCLWKSNGSEDVNEPLVEEIDERTFHRLKHVLSHPDLEDLLG